MTIYGVFHNYNLYIFVYIQRGCLDKTNLLWIPTKLSKSGRVVLRGNHDIMLLIALYTFSQNVLITYLTNSCINYAPKI